MIKNYKFIFFDLDRTLWDFDSNVRDAFEDIIEEFELQKKILDLDTFIKTYDKHNEKLWSFYRKGLIKKEFLRHERFNLTLRDFNISDHGLASEIGERYLNIAPSKKNLIPGTSELLSHLLEKNYKLGIITNGFKEVQTHKLKNCEILNFFTKVITSDDAGYQKPRKEIFEYALTTCNAKKNESIMIGDDFEIDIEGAKKFGMDQVFFNHSNNTRYSFKPTFEINDLKQLKEIFK